MALPFIDIDYYRNDYVGIEIEDDVVLDRLIRRASRDINTLTKRRIGDLSTWHPDIQDMVKEATAAQVEFLFVNGETASTIVQGTAAGGGVRVGSYSENEAGGSRNTSLDGMYADNVVSVLLPSGLLYTGVSTRRGVYRGGCIG
ncbi:conserved hypothetical protein [Exiguobacterium sp. 8H]|uniref:hypothetical protein n=1 Tax=unclassified Exiguobacterium TaxID=2644629 RepID=UPI0012F3960E|nr:MULTISPECIES: hypothetical protein [unclassified Exiguobacterium]VXB51800.1 conserved hypothetical protein [Exiguobacterium sp. 8A]VXB52543.1 conserved hypothetical protein [Exiguobacterium sp. 8H]